VETTKLRKTPLHQVLCPEALVKYVEIVARTGRHDMAAAAVGATTSTTQKWRNASKRDPKDPRFQVVDPDGFEAPQSFHEAVEAAWQGWLQVNPEAKLIELSMGYKDPVIYQGRIAFEPDTTAEPRVDPTTGTIYYPPKLDPLTGEPIPLTITKVSEGSLRFFMEKRDTRYRDKSEVDITTGGKPIFFPAKATDMDAFLAANGASRVKVKKPDPNA
jgi:hypothetical protein